MTPPSADTSHTATALRLAVGDRTFRLEPERVHILGSGPKADLRIEHPSLAPAHAFVSAHEGKVVLEPVGADHPVQVGALRLHGAGEVPVGHTIRCGDVELLVLPPAADVQQSQATAHLQPQPFAALMADELRRAPWFGLSVLLHCLALLALLQFWNPPRPRAIRNVEVQLLANETEALGDELDAEAPAPEVEESEEIAIDEDPFEADFEEETEAEFIEPDPEPHDPIGDMGAYFAEIMARGGDDILEAGGFGAGVGGTRGNFRRTVEQLRRTGLEIVFVFDSTGSMGPVIEATRSRMARMIEALHALVPDTRIGVVTYRDRGRYEDYVTRSVPLSADFYGALLFMYTVTAEGGGDRPEAVLEGLTEAIRQRWKPGSRRAIVLIGDAPAHDDTNRKIKRELRRFTGGADGAAAHAITTSSDFFGVIQDDTRESFELIAKAGDGLCLEFENDERILEQVLSLAIGAEHRSSVAEVFSILDERSAEAARDSSVPRAAELETELLRPQVDPFFVARCVRSQDPELASHLIGMLQRKNLRPSARHAAAWILQRMLELNQVLVDPLSPEPLSTAGVAYLERHVSRLRKR